MRCTKNLLNLHEAHQLNLCLSNQHLHLNYLAVSSVVSYKKARMQVQVQGNQARENTRDKQEISFNAMA